MSSLICLSRRFLLMIAMTASLLLLPTTGQAEETIDPAERARVETIVRDYLLNNPEILLEAMRALEKREQAMVERQRDAIIANLIPTLAASPMTPIIGADDSDVVVVEFFDYQCSYCKRMFPSLKQAMESDEKLKVIFVEFPILGPASLVASRAALAAQKQGKYLDYHVALMQYQGRLTEEVIFQKADAVGLDVEQLKQDMADPDIIAYLEMTREVAGHLNVQGTPAMVINGQYIGGFIPDQEFQAAIAKARS